MGCGHSAAVVPLSTQTKALDSEDAIITPHGGTPLSIYNFQLLDVIGKGGFGCVYLGRCLFETIIKPNPDALPSQNGTGSHAYIHENHEFPPNAEPLGAHVAIKLLPRTRMLESGSVLKEQAILRALSFPFIVNIRHAFLDQKHAYLVLDYAPYGDLFSIVSHLPKPRLSEPVVKYYAACLVLALGYIHNKGVLHRDIKPENIVLDAHGAPRLTDFGVSEFVDPTSKLCNSVSGTRPFLAPEVFLPSHAHSFEADWYALGVTLFQLLHGYRPCKYPLPAAARVSDHLAMLPPCLVFRLLPAVLRFAAG